ncbi:Rho termination factor N-terminal domain-containing protein [Paenibacillus graminis]|uniref:Rho termination factor N-terminal domain-containing protein n=1 Tax=Paenibacillus graminis TaxID=189425 RepID=UPI002DBD3B71|nr:Rho termination factor N-terminal domain-containing protein [Paenibacillus graminis]MEC0171660.1 Rho termination factor N-terminal domain-containing protein [Paenibacillus graminis]
MICHICKNDFSDSVYPHHVERCEELEQQEKAPKTPEKMKLPELKDYAEKHGIDLGEASKKEEVLAVVLAATQKAGEQDAGRDSKVPDAPETTTPDTD